ncbi:MAG: RluA family pseudouridine synthase [Candidatus Moraniibacteriota bacterium]
MRFDLFIKNNLLLLLKNTSHFSALEKKELLKLPRSFWQKEIILGNIKIQNKVVKPSYSTDVSKISSVNVVWKNIINNWNIFFREHLLSYPASLSVLLVKPGFLVINKPAGISVHPAFPLNQNLPRNITLIELLTSYYPDVKLVHRLDKETTGVLLAARNAKTENYFKKQFKNHRVKKEYFALVEGKFPYKKFSIAGMIGKSQKNPILRKMANIEVKELNGKSVSSAPSAGNVINSKYSLTYGEKIASGSMEELIKTKPPVNKILGGWKKYLKMSNKKFTLFKLTPKTGRTHQLRVHLSTIGYPIVGDKLYGSHRFKHLPFHCLHAYSLQWANPASNKCSAKTAEIIMF